ncbi:MAG: DRTGG domain-containing protein [Planctomycetota bacterium]
MKPLFITSVSDYAGKNLLLTGLGLKMQSDGYRINFFKPLGNRPMRLERILSDEDAAFFHEIFGLKNQLTAATAVLLTDELLERLLAGRWKIDLVEKINQALKKFTEADITLIKGVSRFYRGSILGSSEISLIKEFNWPTIVVDRLTFTGETIDGFMGAKRSLGNLLLGVVFNYVPLTKMSYLKKKVVPFLKKNKVEVLGIIPQSAALESVSVKEIKNALSADLICGKDRLENTVEKFCPGIMNVENALRYFRREMGHHVGYPTVECLAVVTEGDRADIQLAALESNACCLILTGHLYPDDIILSRAEERNVPVLVVHDDTLKIMNKLEKLTKHIGLETLSKVKEANKIVRANVNIKAIYQKLGLR